MGVRLTPANEIAIGSGLPGLQAGEQLGRSPPAAFEALGPLRLTDPARQALIERGGPWRDILALAEALERHDLTSAGELADAFGGLDRVLTLSDEAWGWAASVQRELDA